MFAMNILEFSALIWLGSLASGLWGALTGLSGGARLVLFLTLAFNVDMRDAIGASLISVLATSSGAAAADVQEGFTHMRVGMCLEIATTRGALADTPQHAGGGQVMHHRSPASRPNLGRLADTRGGPVP
jgi:uncharacterized membrane protein YfcA